MLSNNNSFEDKKMTNYTVKISVVSIVVCIIFSFLIWCMINGGWK